MTTVRQISALAERRRAMSIQLYGLDRGAEDAALGELDEIAALTRDVLGTDGAGVNLLVETLQVTVASTIGVLDPVRRETSICSAVLAREDPTGVVEIPDLREHPDLAGNPFVDGRVAAVRFYAAAPLVGMHGLALGTLCTWSEQPRTLDALQRRALRQFGRAAVNVLDERRRTLTPDSSGTLRLAR